MTELRQRQEPIRSRAYLDGARGENCKLRFPGCFNDRETVVACHITDSASFGMGQKADDISIIDGCAHCHRQLDLRLHGMSQTLLLEYLLRGIQETMRNRIERGILTLKLDTPKPAHSRPAKPRKPAAERRKVPAGRALTGRGFDKGVTRKFSGQVLYRASTGTTEDTGAGE
jgi:hypothetical protein